MEFDPKEAEFYEMNARRNESRALAKRFNEVHKVPHTEAIRSSDFLENKMLAHPFWENWAGANREEAFDIQKRAAIREQIDKEKAAKMERDADARPRDRQREREREP